jgi:2-iminobutanoate/2-iminopropanoate deaminase
VWRCSPTAIDLKGGVGRNQSPNIVVKIDPCPGFPAAKSLSIDRDSYRPHASFAQGVEVGDTIYVAGQVSIDEDGKLVGSAGDMDAQVRQTFKNVEKVLAEARATLDHVVKMTCHITDVSKYRDYAAVRAELFQGNLPASATVVVAALVMPELLIEIDAIAVR